MPTIDADAHVLETPHTWSFMTDAEAKFRPDVIIHTGENLAKGNAGNVQRESWCIDGRLLTKQKNVGEDTPESAREMRDIDLRLRHMDELEIDVQVLYPTVFLKPFTARFDIDLAMARSYNRWLAEIWKKGQGRLRWVAVPPLLSMDKLRDEIAWCKEHGACGIFIRGLEHDKRPTDPYFFPLYALAEEFDLPVCMHSGNGSLTVQEIYRDEFFGFGRVKALVMASFHSFVMERIPDRFPKLRLGFVEAGAGWLPYMLNDLKQRHLRQGKPFPKNLLAEKRLFVTAETTEDIAYIANRVGEDNLMIGTDYGHSDITAQIDALKMLKTAGRIPASLATKMLDDNPRRLYGL